MDRRVGLLCALLCALILAYFYAADRIVFSSLVFVQIFRTLLFEYDLPVAWLALGLSLLAAWWRHPQPILRVVDFLGAHALPVAATSVLFFCLGTLFVYHDHPLSMDEYAAVFQSRVFAAGQLTAHLPPSVIDWLVVPGFNGSFLLASHQTGDAMEAYWPGFAMLLAPFQLLGIPWACNAFLAGVALYLIWLITLEITGERRAAGWALLFAIASGAFVANAISYYSMQAHLTCNLLYAWLLLKPDARRVFAAGLVGSLALVLHNPYPHTVFAIPWLIAIVISPQQRRLILPLVAGYLPILAAVGVGWLYLRGIVTSGHSRFEVIATNLGTVYRFPDWTIFEMRAGAFVKLWVWAVPCLLVFAALGWRRYAADPRVRLLALSAVCTFAGYVFVALDQGHGWGYRYFHSAWGVVPILAGCALSGPVDRSPRLAAFAGAVAILNLGIVVPLQLLQIDHFIAGQMAQLGAPKRPGNNVYFIKAGAWFYMADLIQIDPLLRSQDLILSSRGNFRDHELMRQNWPDATRVSQGLGYQQWSLGPVDRRRAVPGNSAAREFAPAFVNPAAAPGAVH